MLQTTLSVLGYIAVCLAMLVGLILTPLGLPGNWLILGCALVYGFATQWVKFGLGFVGILAVAALVGEVIEALASAVGAKRYGASAGGSVAAIVGSIVGAVIGSGIAPILGTIVGAFAGAFGGAFLYEYVRLNDTQKAMQAGLGAFLGKTAATIIKELIGVMMVALIVYQFFA